MSSITAKSASQSDDALCLLRYVAHAEDATPCIGRSGCSTLHRPQSSDVEHHTQARQSELGLRPLLQHDAYVNVALLLQYGTVISVRNGIN